MSSSKGFTVHDFIPRKNNRSFIKTPDKGKRGISSQLEIEIDLTGSVSISIRNGDEEAECANNAYLKKKNQQEKKMCSFRFSIQYLDIE